MNAGARSDRALRHWKDNIHQRVPFNDDDDSTRDRGVHNCTCIDISSTSHNRVVYRESLKLSLPGPGYHQGSP